MSNEDKEINKKTEQQNLDDMASELQEAEKKEIDKNPEKKNSDNGASVAKEDGKKENKEVDKNPETQSLDDIVSESEEAEKKEKKEEARGEEKPKIVVESKDTKFYTKILRFIIKKLRFLGIVFLVFASIYFAHRIYRYVFGYYIVAEFEKLPPIYHSIPVYYKGFKVGETGKIRPNTDFTKSKVRIVLSRRLGGIPDNIVAKMKKLENDGGGKQRDYLELEYPMVPSTSVLKKGTIIEGHATMDVNAFLTSQADSGAFTVISDNMGKTFESAEKTSDEIRGLVSDIREIIQENRPNLKEASTNLASATKSISKTTENINEASSKLNRSLSEQKLSNAVSNLEQSTDSLHQSMKNVQGITENIDRATKNLDQTMNKVNQAVDNASEISGGLKDTMGKRFGGARLMFGTPIQSGSSSSTPTANAAAAVKEGVSNLKETAPQEGLPPRTIQGNGVPNNGFKNTPQLMQKYTPLNEPFCLPPSGNGCKLK